MLRLWLGFMQQQQQIINKVLDIRRRDFYCRQSLIIQILKFLDFQIRLQVLWELCEEIKRIVFVDGARKHLLVLLKLNYFFVDQRRKSFLNILIKSTRRHAR